MLKLTKLGFGDVGPVGPIYVAPSAIIMLSRIEIGSGAMVTELTTAHRCTINVAETPEEIMAMPEMRLHLYPAFVLNPGPAPAYYDPREQVFTR